MPGRESKFKTQMSGVFMSQWIHGVSWNEFHGSGSFNVIMEDFRYGMEWKVAAVSFSWNVSMEVLNGKCHGMEGRWNGFE